jgi:hypothetical protein
MRLSSIGIIVWSRTSSSTLAQHVARLRVTVPATDSVPTSATSTSSSAPVSLTPTQVTWLQVGLGALSLTATAGRAAIRSGVPSGFARTQSGAVMAAIQILGRLSWAGQTAASMHAVAAASTTPAAQAVKALTTGHNTDPR